MEFQVIHALKAAEYWDFVTGNADPASQGYDSKKQKAFSSVLQCIGQKNIPAMMNCTDPKELWDTLCQLFERKTVSNKLMQLYGLHMKKGTKLRDHICHLDELSD